MVRFTFKSLLGQPFTSGPTVCTAKGTYSLALVSCSSEFVIKAPGTPTKELRPISIVGSSLILLGLTLTECLWCGSRFNKGGERSWWLSSSVVQDSTALLCVPQMAVGTVSGLW